MINESEAAGGIGLGKGNPNTGGNPASVSLFPQKIPYYLTGDRIQVASMGCRKLTVNTSNILFRDKVIVAQSFNQFPVGSLVCV